LPSSVLHSLPTRRSSDLFSEYSPIYDPDGNESNVFGSSIAIGTVTSAGSQDLVVGADSIIAKASNSGAGKVWVFPAGGTTNAFADRKSTRLNSSHQIISY